MSRRDDLITKHIADISALNAHILEAVERQREDATVKKLPDANTVVIDLERVLRSHGDALGRLAEAYGGGGESLAKQAVTAVAGAVAGLYDKLRESEVTRMLRDDYTALALAAMGYTAMHTFGLAVGEAPIAEAAEQHLRDITPLQVSISRVLPYITVAELSAEADGEFVVNGGVADEAMVRTQEAWKNL